MQNASTYTIVLAAATAVFVFATLSPSRVLSDGWLAKRSKYTGSIEELAQEAIIIFDDTEAPGDATEDLLLKVTVQGAVDEFAWVIPFRVNRSLRGPKAGYSQSFSTMWSIAFVHQPTRAEPGSPDVEAAGQGRLETSVCYHERRLGPTMWR